MKSKNILAVGALAAMFLCGCSDSFLELDSPTQNSIEDYFTTEEHVYEALIAAYDPLQWPDWNGDQYNPVNMVSDIMADDVWVGGSDATDNQFMHLMMNFEATPNICMSGLWSVEYSGVKRCNDVITYLEWAGDTIDDETRDSYEAQARVLRDYYYNNLWKFWGNIPYYTENLEDPYLTDQWAADDVYEAMITDLEEAIDIDALPMKEDDASVGLVTKAMAYMLYAEIVMYQCDESRYSQALDYMLEIINSGEYSLNSDYAALWEESGEWCSESIWEINYKDDDAVRSWDGPLVAGGTVLPRLISPYNFSDTSGSGLTNGWGFEPIRLETYERYEEGDTRRDATCLRASDYGTYSERYQDTGYFLGKYIAYSANNADQLADGDLNFNNNLRVYRYAECLLNAAELLIRTGGSTSTATTYLNEVRSRAGLTDTKTASIDNIIDERQLEFVGEGKRYWDLVRTGKASSVLVPDDYGYRTNTWTENKKYLPIAQTEIDAAQGTLTQNDY